MVSLKTIYRLAQGCGLVVNFNDLTDRCGTISDDTGTLWFCGRCNALKEVADELTRYRESEAWARKELGIDPKAVDILPRVVTELRRLQRRTQRGTNARKQPKGR